MQDFTIKPDGFNQFRKTILLRMCAVMIMIILIVFFLPWLMAGGEGSAGISSATWLTLVLLSAAMTYSLFTTLKKQKAQLLSYKLTITEEHITRELMNTPTITLLKKDVREILKNADGSFAIIGDSKLNAIGVPAPIERKEELEALLTQINALTVKSTTPWLQKLQLPIAFAVTALMFATFYIQNKYIATFTGLIVTVIMIYSSILIRKSKNIDSKTKRISYMMLIPLLAVIGSVILKWLI